MKFAEKKTLAQPRAEASKLSRVDWLDAAFQAVVEGGFDQVRVLVLAGNLGVTRGSFYWHFKSHADLIAALLARWLASQVEVDVRQREGPLPDAQADLERLLDAALTHAGADLGNMRFELALRGVGRRDPAVAQMLVEVDQMRLRLFAQKFERLTGDAKVANDLAGLFYLTLVGCYQSLSQSGSSPNAKAYFKGIIMTHLIRPQGQPSRGADNAHRRVL